LIKHKSFMNITVLIPTLIVGLGLALALPWLANTQGQAAEIEFDPNQESTPDALARYYVSINGDGSDGLSWDTAFTNVQDALGVAAFTNVGEIWVAAGIYYPDEGVGQIDNSVTSTFLLMDNMVLYGGFDTNDTKLSDRDWETNITVLSGDIDGDDITDNNAYHVITADGTTGTPITKKTVLDGFTITAGHAYGPKAPNYYGGGFYCDGSGSGNECSPSLRNVTFTGNSAEFGGAMYNDGSVGISNPSLINVTFSVNHATERGGAMYNNAFRGESSSILTNVTFSGNTAAYGGAIYNDGYEGDSSPSLINVTFSGNGSSLYGGAMYNTSRNGGTSSPTLTNVTFSGNSAGWNGGALYNFGTDGNSIPVVRNSILWNNKDSSGTGTISATIYNKNASTTLIHSLVQGSLPGGSWIGGSYVNGGANIDTDPLFITQVDPDTTPTTAGNLRLSNGSPAVDKGNNAFVSVDFDLDNKLRIVDGDFDGTPTVDMGAYEFGGVTYIPLIFR